MANIDQIRRLSKATVLLALAIGLPLFAPPAYAQVCPFADGTSSLEVEGLILTRYALGLTGAPLVASTGINASDAPTVEATINCPSCGLHITGNATLTVADATIISRKLAGFAGSTLTDGLALGSGTRNTPAAVQSFLLSGCGATGGTVTSISAGTGLTGGSITTSGTIAADTAYLQRRVSSTCTANSFITAIAADGTVTCATPITGGGGTVTSISAGSGLTGGTITGSGTIAADTAFLQRRVSASCAVGSSIRVIAADGTVTCQTDNAGPVNAFVQGGNAFGVSAMLGTTDFQPLKIASGGAQVSLEIPGGNGLRVVDSFGSRPNSPRVINGSASNAALGQSSTVAGGGSTGTDCLQPSNGGFNRDCANVANADGATVGGGGANIAGGQYSVIAGGYGNITTALFSTVAGGFGNGASGAQSYAAGQFANAIHTGSFVWADSTGGLFNSGGDNTFNVRARGGLHISDSTSQFFGVTTRQMLNLWGTQYGIGVQSGTTYFRTDTPANSGSFSWHSGGIHNDGANQPGSGGQEQMRLDSSANLRVRGTVTAMTVLNTSDRNAKTLFESVNAKSILAKVAALPISQWVYRSDEKQTRHLGPMAQDFKRLFGVGQDDKTIATVDAAGVALAAIQGLNLKLAEALTLKDAEIAALKKKLAAIEKRLGM